MSSLRTSRTRLVGAAVTVVIAALSLSACNDGTGVKDEGASAATSTNKSSSTAKNPSSHSHDSSSGSGSSSSDAGATTTGSRDTKKTPESKKPVSSGKAVTCEGSNTKTVAAPLNRPVNHMLLTVTNTGSKTCYLYGYPSVRFGEAQSVPPVIEDSQPQAVVTLDPGESGYAAVALSAADGSASNGHTVKSLAVYFSGRSGNESVGKGANPALPAKGAYVDDSLKVTYWQQSMDDAISW